jgi:hypothetical protein
VLVTGGRLGDTYGRKRMFLLGMAGFTIASAVCGAAPGALTLIVARVVQGMSSGLMFPQVLGIIQVVFSQAQRARAIGCRPGARGSRGPALRLHPVDAHHAVVADRGVRAGARPVRPAARDERDAPRRDRPDGGGA